jgi:hypothetical protein
MLHVALPDSDLDVLVLIGFLEMTHTHGHTLTDLDVVLLEMTHTHGHTFTDLDVLAQRRLLEMTDTVQRLQLVFAEVPLHVCMYVY